MKAILRKARISPKKANLVAGMVRRKSVTDALDILSFTPKKGAKILFKVLTSAVANAENNFAQDKKKLLVKHIIVNEAATFKRWLPVSRGRSHPLLKRNSHITVEVGVDESRLNSDSLDLKDVSDKKKVENPVAVKPKQGVSSKEAVIKKVDRAPVENKGAKAKAIPGPGNVGKPTMRSQPENSSSTKTHERRSSR
jgi:large subunit ribosomal protein L22